LNRANRDLRILPITELSELSDFSVCTTWGVSGKNLFLLSVFRRRLEYPVLKRAMRKQQSLFGASVVLIEEGLGHPADPGADHRGLPWRHAVPADRRTRPCV
jgi:hypothetical protein